jgi:hypothetical protein
VMALGDTFHLEHLSYRGGPRRYGRSVGLCAPGLFVSILCRVPLECWRQGGGAQRHPCEIIATLPLWRSGQEAAQSALASLSLLRGERPARPVLLLSGMLCGSRYVPARGRSGASSLAGSGTRPAGGL